MEWPFQKDCDTFYGNPRGVNGGPSRTWENVSLTTIPCPWALMTAWEPHQPVSRIRFHRKCSDALGRALWRVWEAAGKDQKQIEAWGLHLFGGSYMFRTMRGSTRLSMHSWGCAIDFDPARNGLGDSTPFIQPNSPIVTAFKAEGAVWGGDWNGNGKVADERRPDAMHFQFARI